MAHIIMRRKGGVTQLVVNGVDLSMEIYRDIELVEVGAEHPETAEVGLRVTLVVGRLDLDTETDIQVTDHFLPVAQRVRSMSEEVA